MKISWSTFIKSPEIAPIFTTESLIRVDDAYPLRVRGSPFQRASYIIINQVWIHQLRANTVVLECTYHHLNWHSTLFIINFNTGGYLGGIIGLLEHSAYCCDVIGDEVVIIKISGIKVPYYVMLHHLFLPYCVLSI